MDFIQKEIERKRKLKETLNQKLQEKEGQPKKYRTQGEYERLREENYLAEQEKHKAKEKQKQQVEETPENENPNNEQEILQGEVNRILQLPEEEIICRFRERNLPIRLFGELDVDRALRLHRVQEKEAADKAQEEKDELGQNEFGRLRKKLENETEEDRKKDMDDETEAAIKDKSTEGSAFVMTKENFILQTLGKILKEWDQQLHDRPEIEKRTSEGKSQTAVFQQCRQHMKPLFKILRAQQLPTDMLIPIHEICSFLEEREYIKAHDAYLRMAIGNAPWPMGVTMVGIHERSAREKIFSNQIAHVLNDETQRKYIQGLKRLMTTCQNLHPPEDPSKKMG